MSREIFNSMMEISIQLWLQTFFSETLIYMSAGIDRWHEEKKIKSNYHFLTLMIPKLTISLYSGVEFLSVCQGKYALATCKVHSTSRMLSFK